MEAPCSRFTPAEGGARLAATATCKNTLAVEYASFISTRMIYEDAYKIRGSLFDGRQRSVYVTRTSRVDVVAYELNILTDLKICKAVQYEDVYDWYAELEKKEVLVCTSAVLRQILEEEILMMSNINVLVMDSSHLVCRDAAMQYIMKLYKESEENSRPKILALTYPLFSYTKQQSTEGSKTTENSPKLEEISEKNHKNSENENSLNTEADGENLPKQDENLPMEEENLPKLDDKLPKQEETAKTLETSEIDENKDLGPQKKIVLDEIGVYENLDDFKMYEQLEWKIEQLEKELCCQMDLAEDIDGGKRLSSTLTKPKEVIIEHETQLDPGHVSEEYKDLEMFMRDTVYDALAFIDEHRYDPTEIYGEDMYEELKSIPDPTIEPKYIFSQFLYVLDQLGPYAADKAAFSLLTKLEKLKIKVPYERHFLLLCLCTSVFVKIRCYADLVFSKYESDWEKIKAFCTPKIMRFAEILEKFCPEVGKKDVKTSNKTDTANESNNETTNASKANDFLKTLDGCDFIGLSNKIEDRVNTIEANLKDLDYVNEKIDEKGNNLAKDDTEAIIEEDNVINDAENDNSKKNEGCSSKTENSSKTESCDSKIENCSSEKQIGCLKNEDKLECENSCSKSENSCSKSENKDTKDENIDLKDVNLKIELQSCNKTLDQKGLLGFSKRQGHRIRGRGRAQRPNQSRSQLAQQNPDALCGIVYMQEPLMAKIMFMLIVDMSRSYSKLSYICAQYCAVEEPANPAEIKECQRQGKKREDVLKKFRMHECNLLLATSALEEGIDLPRCNLVLRWDAPQHYRSYGLCRSRARAPRSACALLAGSDSSTLVHNVAVYRELDQIISRKCGCGIQDEPLPSEEDHADSFTHVVKPYTPNEMDIPQKNNKNENVDSNCDKTTINNEDGKNNDINIDKFDKITDDTNKNSIDDSRISNIDSNTDKTIKTTENLICNKYNDNKIDKNNLFPLNDNDSNTSNVKDVKTIEKKEDSLASVDLNSAIALINKYCGKLPSDTFTRLAPQWWMEKVKLPIKDTKELKTAYICTLRLPLNCPVKYNIVGHPMPTKSLARRMVALQTCRILHKSGELDNQLMPIGKENFKAAELDATNVDLNDVNDSARPGTTKRRQYYFKRTAWAFTDCQPVVDTMEGDLERDDDDKKGTDDGDVTTENSEVKNTGKKRNMLYAIVSKLWCALPERYNTRGRRLHAPQNASQAIGILMAREEPDSLQIPSFPVYTRSGEVRVSVEYVPDADVRLTPLRGRKIRRFMRFVFAEVLRVRRRGMKLQSESSTHNNYYIVPTIKTTKNDGTTKIDIDWNFLDLIYNYTEEKKHSEIERPNLWQNDEEEKEIAEEVRERDKKSGGVKEMANPLLKEGEVFVFDADKYREAVVTPWYRNRDQPQFFLVAEICWNLTPDSAFPSALHTTFRQYYKVKYGVTLTQTDQPLLDVDHTSNRLNLLTPRYVNRKGVALPVSSERTRRAKRDRLDQKQILVPELCRVHPFAAPLWFATVALPCVLYRINALLIADEIRRSVAIDVGLGIPKIDEQTCPGFQWPPLDFGWSLAEVLNADEKTDKKKEEDKKEEPPKEQEAIEKEQQEVKEGKEKTVNDILQEKECNESGFEIGTWSNEMASSIPEDTDYDEYMEPLPPNLTFCTSASGGTNWCDPIEKPKSQFQPSSKYNMADSDCSYMSSDFDTDDSDMNSDVSDDDDTSGFCSSRNSNAAMGVRIEYKTAHEAEAVDVERKKKVNPAPTPDAEDDALDRKLHEEFIKSGQPPAEYVDKFRNSVEQHKSDIKLNGSLIKHNEPLEELLPEPTKESQLKARIDGVKLKSIEINTDLKAKSEIPSDVVTKNMKHDIVFNENEKNPDINKIAAGMSKIDLKADKTELIDQMFPFANTDSIIDENGQISLENIEKNKRILLSEFKKSLSEEEIKKLNCFSMIDVDIDSPNYVNEKVVNVGFDKKENYHEKVNKWRKPDEYKPYYLDGKSCGKEFDFDYQPNLEGHPGPSPSVILQALTMSNANDGINLERLETIGDSFLKFAITAYLYCAHPTVHEGKLSHMRSKQVSNLNLYRLGRNKRLGARMIASKFEPHDNWLPPCHKPPNTLHPRINDKDDQLSPNPETPMDNKGCFIPYNLITQHSIPDKSIADCVEALIGAYLLECGPLGALLLMSWLGIRVLPRHEMRLPEDHPYVKGRCHANANAQKPSPAPAPRRCDVTDSETELSEDEDDSSQQLVEVAPEEDWTWPGRPLGSLRPHKGEDGHWYQTMFGQLKAPPSPLLRYISDPEGELERMLSGYEELERTLQYRFSDRSLLLQALTHASHQQNRLTDCYQRLEFLGDAILDYLITRHLYEDPRRHSPGALTDLRSALVNNTIFATLGARHGFHKYFRHTAPGLDDVLAKYVRIQEESGHSISEEHYLIQEDEMEQAEDVEVPKALGDLFESVAGAIFLDSGMSLGAVWKSYVNLMGAELEAFSAAAPKSPVRELLEAEPDTAKFGKPERLADGRRVRVCVEVFGRGAFKGVGRNYRIAKGTAARCALRHLKGRQHR